MYAIHDRSQIISGINSNIAHIENLLGKLCINNITKTVSRDIVQNLIYFKNADSSSFESVIRDVIVRELAACESRSCGSSEIMILCLLDFLKTIAINDTPGERILLLKKTKEEINETCIELSSYIKRATLSDIKNIIRFQNLSKNIEEITLDAISKTDPRNSCDVEKTARYESYMEKIEGHIVEIDGIDLHKYNIKKWKKDSSKCILVDGIIERVSQINHILEIFLKSKDPLIIFCREAKEEVRETIRVNYLRKTLDVILVEVGFDIEYLHFFKDMNAIFGCDYANIKKGDVISAMIKDLIFTVDNIKVENNSISIKGGNIKNKNFLKLYIADILSMRGKIDESTLDIEEIGNIKRAIDRRLSFLSSSKIKLNIGKLDIDRDNLVISKIDKIFRSFPDISSFGIIDLKNTNVETRLFKEVFAKIDKDIFSQKEIFDGLISAYRVFETILKTEKLFTIEADK
jgi:hypothetical protein